GLEQLENALELDEHTQKTNPRRLSVRALRAYRQLPLNPQTIVYDAQRKSRFERRSNRMVDCHNGVRMATQQSIYQPCTLPNAGGARQGGHMNEQWYTQKPLGNDAERQQRHLIDMDQVEWLVAQTPQGTQRK